MKSNKLVWSFLILVAGFVLSPGPVSLHAATPADQNFNSVNGPGISSRVIGDWQFRLLDALGEEDSLGGDFVDIIDNTYTNLTGLASGSDRALFLEGTLDLVTEAQIRSRYGDPFSLLSLHIDGSDTEYRITGYLGGLPVTGATQTVYSAAFEDTTITFTNTLFQNIDEFRISREDGDADISFFIDDIDVTTAVPTSANPVIGNLTGDSVIYLEGSPAVRLDAGTGATVTDSDSADFHGGAIVVSITAGRIPPQDVLSITNQGTGPTQVGVSGTNLSYGGTLVGSFTGGSSYDDLVVHLNNNASKTAAAGILRALTYHNTSTGVPATGARGVTIRLYDGDGGYAVATVTVTVQQNNYAPTAHTAYGTNLFNEGINEPSYPIVVDETVTADDADNTQLASGLVSIIRNFVPGEDLLLFTNIPATMGNITGSYSTNTGVLTLTSDGASATLTNWSAALRGVYYSNDSDTPSTTTRTITFALSDGADTGAGSTNFVRVAAYNDAPVNTIPTNTLPALLGVPLVFSGATAVSVSDADAGNNSIQVALTPSAGTLSLSGVTGLTFITGDGTDDAQVAFTGTLPNINAALAGMSYLAPDGHIGSANIVVFTSDLGMSGPGGFLTDSDTIEMFVTPPPAEVVSIAATNANGIYLENSTIGIEISFNQNVFVNTNGGTPTLQLETGGTNSYPATYADGSGTSNLLFLYTVQIGHQYYDLNYPSTNSLELNGGAISNLMAEAAGLTLPAPSAPGSLGMNSDIRVDGASPSLLDTFRPDPAPVSATNVDIYIYFSEGVDGVDVSDFTLTFSGTATGIVQSVAQYAAPAQPFTQHYLATISHVTGNGTLRLDLKDSGTGIADDTGHPISGGFTNGDLIVIDTAAPSAPVFTGISDDTGAPDDQLTADTTLVLHGTAESNTLVTVTRVGTGVIGVTNANDAGVWSLDYRGTLLPVGTNIFTAIATDAASNASPASANFEIIIFDNILPTIDAITRGGGSPTAATNVTFLVAFSEPIDGVDIADFTLVTSGSATGVVAGITQTGPFPDHFEITVANISGEGTLRLDLNDAGTGITDLAGQAFSGGYTNGEAYAVDTIVPPAPVITAISEDTGVNGDRVTVDATLVLSGTAEADSTVTLTRAGSGIIGSTNANGSGAWSFDYTGTELPEGTNIFTATATDATGNTSAVSAAFAVIVDRSFSLRFLSTPTLFVAKKPAVKVDASAVLDAGSRTHLGGGQLLVAIPTNGTSGDVLSVYTASNSSQGISLTGTNILWGDLLIATLARGHAVTNPLTFTFTTNATPSAVQALVREISFLTTNASTLARTLRFVLTDGFGSPAISAHKTIVINKALPVGTVASLFTNSVGTFSGLVTRTNDVVVSEAGAFLVKITPGLKYSGYVLIAGRKTSFSGQFNTNGESSIITSGNKFGVDLQLTPDAGAIFGRLTSYTLGGWSSDLTGHLTAIGRTTNNAVAAGAYTLLLPSSNDPEVGSGWATITVDRLGQAKLKGTLGDGLAWTAGSAIGTNAHWPLYASVDKKLGAVIGWLTFSNTTPAVIGGTLTWLKPVSAPYFANGIAAELDANGSRYIAPAGTNAILGWTNGALSLANGNLAAALTNTVNLTTLGKFTGSSGSISNLKFSINAKAGSFSGSFRHPASGRTTKYSGVLLQSENLGGGQFLGTNRGGVLRLEAAE